MLVLACLLIQTHDVTKSPLSCFVTLTRFRSFAPSRVRVRAWRPTKEKGPVAGTLGNLVGAEGLEPSILAARDFKSPAYANSATPPCVS